jgi:hypothetical protein
MIQRSTPPRLAVGGLRLLQGAVGLQDAARDLGAGARGLGLRQDAALHVAVHFLQLVAIDLQVIGRRRRPARPRAQERQQDQERHK